MEQVKLGNHEDIPVYPQKWAYLTNRSTKTIVKVISSTEDLTIQKDLGATIFEWAGSSAYQLLVAMIPSVAKRMPEYEFHGFNSREAWEAGDYEEENDPSPTVPEVIDAFNVAMRVNRFDLAGVLKNLIDPKELKGPITKRLVEAISKDSPNSQQQNGESDPTTSLTTPPTSTENGESPSNGSNSSPESTPNGENES